MREKLDLALQWKRWVAPLWRVAPQWLKNVALSFGPSSFRVSAAGVCLDPENRLLVLKHRHRNLPWGLPGGLLKRGESPTEGLVREVREETGLDPEVADILLAASSEDALTLLYYLRVPHVAPDLQEEEIQSCRWVSLVAHGLELPASQSRAAEMVAARLEQQ